MGGDGVIVTDSVLAATLAAAGTQNNPFLAHCNIGATGTVATGVGTELSAAVNAVSGGTYNFWACTPNLSDLATLNFSFASAKTINFIGIAAHNLGSIGAVVRVRYSLDAGATYINLAGGDITPLDDAAIGVRFPAVSATHWQIRAVVASGEDVVIGVALLSTVLDLPSRIYQGYTPPITQTRVELLSNLSEGGHILGTSYVRRGSQISAALKYLPAAFVRGTEWINFQRAFNQGRPIFWAWRPGKYGDIFYGVRGGNELVPTNSGPLDLMSATLDMAVYDDV